MSDDEMLKVHIHYGGLLLIEGNKLCYSGGSIARDMLVDPDLLTFSLFEDFSKNGQVVSDVEKLWYRLPNQELSEARSIGQDKDKEIMQMASEAKDCGEVYVYVGHSVSTVDGANVDGVNVVGDEPLNDNEAVTGSGTARKPHQIESGEEMMKEHGEEADVERLNENRAAKITETTDAKEGHGDNDEFCVVQDAFETLMSHGLSDYQKKMQLEKLLNIGTDKRSELSNEWKSLCVEERRLNLKKLRFSTKLAEAVFQ